MLISANTNSCSCVLPNSQPARDLNEYKKSFLLKFADILTILDAKLRQKNSLREIAQLNDHLLSDIGVERPEIEDAMETLQSKKINHPML